MAHKIAPREGLEQLGKRSKVKLLYNNKCVDKEFARSIAFSRESGKVRADKVIAGIVALELGAVISRVRLPALRALRGGAVIVP